MTKKGVIRYFGGWKSKTFSGKGKTWKIFHGVRTFFGNRGKSETGGNASLPQGEWTPLTTTTTTTRSNSVFVQLHLLITILMAATDTYDGKHYYGIMTTMMIEVMMMVLLTMVKKMTIVMIVTNTRTNRLKVCYIRMAILIFCLAVTHLQH